MHSLLAVPVPCKGPFLGNLYLSEKADGGEFTRDDEETLERFAVQAAIAIDNAHLHGRSRDLAVAQERLRIAHEMHDGIAQVLGYVNTKVQAASEYIRRDKTEEGLEQLRELAEAAREAYSDVRESIVDLRTLPGPARSFHDVLQEYVDRWQEQTGIAHARSPSIADVALPAGNELQLVRIIQESLANVRKHRAGDDGRRRDAQARRKTARSTVTRRRRRLRATRRCSRGVFPALRPLDDARARGIDRRHVHRSKARPAAARPSASRSRCPRADRDYTVSVRILIADDHPLFRDGLRSLLQAQGHEVVGEAHNGREAIELARKLQPDFVLMDVSMPELDGVSATRLIAREMPEVKVVILTASDEDETLFEAIKAGAQGYLLKNLEADDFFALLDRAAAGEPALTPLLARKLLQEFAKPPERRRPRTRDPDALTAREREVLRADGRRHHLEPPAGQAPRPQRKHGQVPRPQHPRQAAPAQPRGGGRLRAAEEDRGVAISHVQRAQRHVRAPMRSTAPRCSHASR